MYLTPTALLHQQIMLPSVANKSPSEASTPLKYFILTNFLSLINHLENYRFPITHNY